MVWCNEQEFRVTEKRLCLDISSLPVSSPWEHYLIPSPLLSTSVKSAMPLNILHNVPVVQNDSNTTSSGIKQPWLRLCYPVYHICHCGPILYLLVLEDDNMYIFLRIFQEGQETVNRSFIIFSVPHAFQLFPQAECLNAALFLPQSHALKSYFPIFLS